MSDAWLDANRVERMDARRPDLFERTRADFHLDRYRFAARMARGRVVADIACGTGYGARVLVDEGGASAVRGIDIDPDAVRYADRTYGGAKIAFARAAAHETPLSDASVDLIASFETIEHISEEGPALAEWARVLRPGGSLVVSTPNRWGLTKNPHHLRDYDPETLDAALAPFFKVVARWAQNSGTPNRKVNHGVGRGFRIITPETAATAECLVYVASRAPDRLRRDGGSDSRIAGDYRDEPQAASKPGIFYRGSC